MSITRRILLPMAGLPVLLLGACQSDGDAAMNAPAVAESPALASPMSERDLRRQREFNEAIAGLTFERGFIEVDPVATPDVARAAEHAVEGARFYEGNQRTESIKAYVLAVRNAPQDARLYVALGDAFVAKSKIDMAAAAYQTAARVDEGLVEARVSYANVLAMDSRTADAIEAMGAVLTIDPDNPDAHERLAVWNYYEGNYVAAWEHVGHARRVGNPVPPQIIPLLERQMPNPGAGS